jgi:hypothetical protein
LKRPFQRDRYSAKKSSAILIVRREFWQQESCPDQRIRRVLAFRVEWDQWDEWDQLDQKTVSAGKGCLAGEMTSMPASRRCCFGLSLIHFAVYEAVEGLSMVESPRSQYL